MTLPAGSRLGRYQIVELLGAGGMGMVYRARDERLQRDVAIKILSPAAFSDETARRRFQKEALALAKLSHPNIAAVYDVGEDADTAYLVMECVSGESLAARLQRSPLAVAEALTVSIQIAGALSEAHEQGVVHRDLKPANVMLTPKGQVKVLDFGLAKLLAPPDAPAATLSRSELGAPAGTPMYMSPEQAFGEPVDARTDLWSLGVVIFESLAGRAPFEGATDWALLKAVTQDPAPSLRAIRPDLPASVESLVTRALTKDLAARYQTAAALGDDAASILAGMSSPAAKHDRSTVRMKWTVLIPAVLGITVLIAGGAWYAVRSAHRTWARNQAPLAIDSLHDANLRLAGFHVLQKAEGYLPGDTTLQRLDTAYTWHAVIRSSPAGAAVAIQDYRTPDSAWQQLGTTPIDGVKVPKGYFRWRVTPAGGPAVITAPQNSDTMRFALDVAAKAPSGMVPVPAQGYEAYVAFMGWVGPYHMPAFSVDKFEVTNRDYQQFVDSGGYRDQRYWQEKFVDHGHALSWDEAIARFRDQSGRAGPATWTGGHYPEGQADYPVAGISWYEAAAYAAFRGKKIPTIAQWHEVAPLDVAGAITTESNMSGTHTVAVGTFPGVGPYGTYDMAGNVREWVFNANEEGNRFILGGSWGSPNYLYAESETMPPFDRSPLNGFRCVTRTGPLPPDSLLVVKTLRRDFATFKPASDAVFHAYEAMYAYDKTPLDAKVEGTVQQTADWRVEKVTFATAYNSERMAAYLYIPSHVKPPYQAVVFFPSARVLGIHDSRNRGDVQFFDYIVQSGRAVLYPVYQNTYERTITNILPSASEYLIIKTQRSKDVGRALDYLQSRPDIAHDKLAYLGVSMGAAEGAVYATEAQDRLRTAVFLDGGYFLDTPPAGGDQADFAPRLTKPVLMVNGRYDATFTYNEAQLPMFRMLGTPAADKKHVTLETAHDVTTQRSALAHEVLIWLDKYLGRVE
ncbi:MAG TPA: protein kinase [Gemmatimonadales bacterium]|jgi:dienelactone hydrolase|nr:protein kinase [Gemmatimonadales bacterium]